MSERRAGLVLLSTILAGIRTPRAAVCILAAPAALVALAWATGGVLGLGWYFLLALLVVLWDVYAVLRTFTLRASPLGAMLTPVSATIVSCHVLVLIVWGAYGIDLWERHRAWYAAAYAAAAFATLLLLWKVPGTRRLRNAFLLGYNIVGALALAAWAACDWNVDAGVVAHGAAQSWGLVQAMVFSSAALLAPIFILPPMLVVEPRPAEEPNELDGRVMPGEHGVALVEDGGPMVEGKERSIPARRPPLWRRAASLGLDASLGAVTMVLLLYLPVFTGAVIGWSAEDTPSEAVYNERPGFEFTAIGRAFTGVARPPDDWHAIVAEEVARAGELGLDQVRYDLYHELLENGTSLERLDAAVAELRGAGLDVMFGLLGSDRWEQDHPTFGEMVEVLRADTLLVVERWTPAWVCPFIEPNGRMETVLGGRASVEEWVAAISDVGGRVRDVANGTRTLVEVRVGDEQSGKLVEALGTGESPVDAIGLSLAILRRGELDGLADLGARAAGGPPRLWVSSFGAEAAMLGEHAQARAVSAAASLASGRLNATGLCVRALFDDTPLPNNFGLVGRDGEPREAFNALRDAIDAVRPGG